MSDLHWSTGITEVKPNELRLRGHRIDDLMGRVTFAEAIYLALVGELPAPAVGRLVDAILVASIDHGATPPSTLTARTAASTGAPLNAALAAGILSINQHHGGAVEDCMRLIMQVVESGSGDLGQAAADLVAAHRAAGKRMAGFGHRIHSADPRVARLFELADEAGIARQGVTAVRLLADALAAQTGRDLPVNVDGALAAVLFDLGIAPELANAFFIMARVPGLVAHIYEEQTRQRPMRPIHPTDHDYDGPAPIGGAVDTSP
jgi:citrate synthase